MKYLLIAILSISAWHFKGEISDFICDTYTNTQPTREKAVNGIKTKAQSVKQGLLDSLDSTINKN